MRVVFFGTPPVALWALDALLASVHEVAGVVTQPDKPRGRGRGVSASPVKERAEQKGLPILQPPTPKDPAFAPALRALRPEALAVVAYGHILPVDVLEIAPAMNVHFSLLPAYRGAAPVQRALMDGVDRTGVSVFLLEPTIDTGPVVARAAIDVGPEQTAGDVFETLAPLGARLLGESLTKLEAGSLMPEPQSDEAASPAPKIKPAEAEIDWTLPAKAIVNLIRGLNPAPGAWTTLDGKRLTIWRARIAEAAGTPGAILTADPVVLGTGDGGVEVVELQLEGKRRLPSAEFVRGRRLSPGTTLGA